MRSIFTKSRFLGLLACLMGTMLCLMPLQALADDFDDYKTNEITGDITLPTISAGYFVAGDFFDAGTTAMIDGTFDAEGRMIVAMGTQLLIQRTYGSSEWDVVATVDDVMDPCFVRPSPDGSTIALGLGYYQDLLVFPTSILSISNPPNLSTDAGVTHFPSVLYYDGEWKDNQYFLIDGGTWPAGPGGCDPMVDPNCDNLCEEPYVGDPDCVFISGVGSVDTQHTSPATHAGVAVTSHDGASADVHVDADGNVIAGIGWFTSPTNRTGEIRIVPASAWDPAAPNNIDFDTLNVLADNILSAAYIGEDAEGNLHVGGGDGFGSGGPDENGYAAIIEASVVDDVAAGSRGPVTDGNKSDNTEYKYFPDDLCEDDSATGIVANTWGRSVGVIWNPTGDGSGGCAGSPGSATDYWMPGVTPIMTFHSPSSADDSDGDGVPDVLDNAYLTSNPGQEDTDGDGYGNVADADFDNSGVVNYGDYQDFLDVFGDTVTDSIYDMVVDESNAVNYLDYQEMLSRFGTFAPWY